MKTKLQLKEAIQRRIEAEKTNELLINKFNRLISLQPSKKLQRMVITLLLMNEKSTAAITIYRNSMKDREVETFKYVNQRAPAMQKFAQQKLLQIKQLIERVEAFASANRSDEARDCIRENLWAKADPTGLVLGQESEYVYKISTTEIIQYSFSVQFTNKSGGTSQRSETTDFSCNSENCGPSKITVSTDYPQLCMLSV